jgi:hypothetical protein
MNKRLKIEKPKFTWAELGLLEIEIGKIIDFYHKESNPISSQGIEALVDIHFRIRQSTYFHTFPSIPFMTKEKYLKSFPEHTKLIAMADQRNAAIRDIEKGAKNGL